MQRAVSDGFRYGGGFVKEGMEEDILVIGDFGVEYADVVDLVIGNMRYKQI